MPAPTRRSSLRSKAHRLAPDLVPAAAIAGRILASRGNTPRAARVLLKTWRLSPHPELAAAYAYVRPGDSPRDRLVRVRHLGRITPNDIEAPIAIAVAAVEAREWDEARNALEPLLDNRLSQRVCTLMARIEAEQHGHTGRVREWLARAVHAPRDPAWTADGVVSDHWAPTSPVTGALDAFRWRVPVEAADEGAAALLSAKVEALVGLGAEAEPVIEHRDRTQPAAETVRGETIEPPVIKPAPKACSRAGGRGRGRPATGQAGVPQTGAGGGGACRRCRVLKRGSRLSPMSPDARHRPSRRRKAIARAIGRGRQRVLLGRASLRSPGSSCRRALPMILAPRSARTTASRTTRSARRRPRPEQSAM